MKYDDLKAGMTVRATKDDERRPGHACWKAGDEFGVYKRNGSLNIACRESVEAGPHYLHGDSAVADLEPSAPPNP